MKHIKSFLVLLIAFVLFFSTPVYAYNPTTDISYERYLTTPFFVRDLNNIQQVEVDMMKLVAMTTPSDLWELFKQEGVRIYITKGVSLTDRKYENSNYNAITYGATFSWNNSKKITKISNRVSVYIYDNTTDVSIYYHEFGHTLDDIAEYITGYYKGQHPISNSSEWGNLYLANASKMATFDSTASFNVPLNATEGFAEAFRLYFVYPQALKQSCPDVYSFVTSQISKYTSYLKPITYDTFDALSYYVTYPDVAEACGIDRKALWNHYVNYGKAEGRIATREAK